MKTLCIIHAALAVVVLGSWQFVSVGEHGSGDHSIELTATGVMQSASNKTETGTPGDSMEQTSTEQTSTGPESVGLSSSRSDSAAAGGVDDISFNRDIRPILAENCFRCHGPDPKTREADLRLDQREAAIEFGAIDPDDPDNSLLLERIESDDDDLVMPPPDSLKQLTAAQTQKLRQWIEAGGEYEDHWAYLPPTVPEISETGSAAIDRLVRAELSRTGLEPSGPADKSTLVRRVYLDLIGLPPTPEQRAAFVNDPRPEAYGELVDTLLASPHYGERMATPWLDVVRYADTVGYHGDQNQNVFPYRDWVIQAFNDNMPFDQFTIEQLAGDLIENPTEGSLIASCFNRLNMMTREGGAQPKEYLIKYAGDRVRTVSGAWLGSTIGCAECHDHKYDPFSAKDFYRLAAFFADLRQWGVYQDYGYTPNPDLRGWSNDHPFPPEITVDVPYLQERMERLRSERREVVREAWSKTTHEDARGTQWVASIHEFLASHPNGFQPLVPTASSGTEVTQYVPSSDVPNSDVPNSDDGTNEGAGQTKRGQPGAFLIEGEKIDTLTLVDLVPDSLIATLSLELLEDPAVPGKIFAGGGANLNLTAAIVGPEGTAARPLPIEFAEASDQLPRYANTFEVLGIHGRWPVAASTPVGARGVWVLKQPTRLSEGEKLQVTITGNRCRHLRLTSSPLVPEDLKNVNSWQGELTRLLEATEPKASEGEATVAPGTGDSDVASSPFLARQWLLTESGADAEIQRVRRIERQILECRDGRGQVQVSVAQEPMVTRVLPRGDWQDETGEVVEPGIPDFLPSLNVPVGQRATRLDLARWLVAEGNPLTARVQMNRLWKQLLGSGLSPVLDDLGIQGEYPSHPELLDWLAVEFRRGGWDYRRMVRLIVMTDVYRQSSRPSERGLEADPQNRLLARQNARRLEAEIIRDNALAIAGLLNRDMGGPPVFPYQPDGYYEHLQFPDRRYRNSDDDRQYRRGIYSHWQRTFLHPMLANFDAPSREECTGLRTEANTPLQALTLLNDPTFVEAARVLATESLQETSGAEERITWLFLRALAREPSPQEMAIMLQVQVSQRAHFAADEAGAKRFLSIGLTPLPATDDVVDLASWTSVARAILNLHETITRY